MKIALLLFTVLNTASADCMDDAESCAVNSLGLLQRGTVKSKLDNLLDTETLDISSFAKEIRTMYKSGKTPEDLATFINSKLISDDDSNNVALKTIRNLQKTLDDSHSAMSACYKTVTDSRADQDTAQSALSESESKESECKSMDAKYSQEEIAICAKFANKAMSFRPAHIETVKYSLRMFESTLYQYYGFYPTFLDLKSACTNITGEEHSQHAQCLFMETHAVNSEYCALRGNLTAMCDVYDTCYKNANAEWLDVSAKVSKLERHTQKLYQDLKCLSLGGVQNGTVGVKLTFATSIHDDYSDNDVLGENFPCDYADAMLSTHMYTINYHDAPPKQRCSNEVPTSTDIASKHTCVGELRGPSTGPDMLDTYDSGWWRPTPKPTPATNQTF